MEQITLDYIMKDCKYFPSYDDTFISAIEKMVSFPRCVADKVVYYDIKKIFNVAASGDDIKIIDGIKYFEFEFPRDGDIISNIKCSSNSKLYINGKTFDSNKRLVLCASMYTNIKFMIMVDESLLVPNDAVTLGDRGALGEAGGDSVKQAPVSPPLATSERLRGTQASSFSGAVGDLGACDPGTGRADSRSEGGGSDLEESLIYISYRVNVLDIELRNNIRVTNLMCDGLVYLDGEIISGNETDQVCD